MPTAADAPAAAEAPPSPDEAVGPTRARWGVLFAFSLLTALNCMMWITFAPVRSQTARFYGVSGDLVDWLSMIFMALYPVVFAPMSWYIETGPVALQRGLRVSAAMNVVAALLRYLSAAPRSFALLFAGQALGSAAQGFTLGAPPRVAALWFDEREWGLATGIGVTANQLGAVLAYAHEY